MGHLHVRIHNVTSQTECRPPAFQQAKNEAHTVRNSCPQTVAQKRRLTVLRLALSNKSTI